MPTVTTIIPTHRRPLLLRRAILSVLGQTFRDVLVRVFDDASGDETADIVGELAHRDCRVKYFCQPQNLGMGLNRKLAVDSVETPFFTILDDDDFLAPDFFSTALEALSRRPDAMIFWGGLIYHEVGGAGQTYLFQTLPTDYYPAPVAFQKVVGENKFQPYASVMFRSRMLQTIGGFDALADWAGDVDFQARALACHASLFDRTPCAVYWRHGGSSCSDGYLSKLVSGGRYLIDKARRGEGYPPEMCDEVFELFRGRYQREVPLSAIRALAEGECEAAEDSARFLGDELGSHGWAAMISLAAGCSPVGAAVRQVLRTVKAIKRREQSARHKETQKCERLVSEMLKNIERVGGDLGCPDRGGEIPTGSAG
jgi:glycosyltransferase involved in cell wall biosynthesis